MGYYVAVAVVVIQGLLGSPTVINTACAVNASPAHVLCERLDIRAIQREGCTVELPGGATMAQLIE